MISYFNHEYIASNQKFMKERPSLRNRLLFNNSHIDQYWYVCQYTQFHFTGYRFCLQQWFALLNDNIYSQKIYLYIFISKWAFQKIILTHIMHKDKHEELNKINDWTIPESNDYYLLSLELVFLIFWMTLFINDWNTPYM